MAFDKNLLSYILLLFSIYGVCCTCPNHWIRYGSSCYHFSSDPQTWVAAEVVCEKIGGYLVEFNSYDEGSFVAGKAQQLSGESYWIGGNDFLFSRSFIWIKSKTKVNPFGRWRSGEPNSRKEHCMVLGGGTTNDISCNRLFRYICER